MKQGLKENEISSNNQPVQLRSAIVYRRISQKMTGLFRQVPVCNQLCKRERERAFYAICVEDNDRYFKNTKSFESLQDRQEKICLRAIYGMIDGSQNTIFS